MEQIINLDIFFRQISRRIYPTNLCFKVFSSQDKRNLSEQEFGCGSISVKQTNKQKMALSKAKETTLECDFFISLCIKGDCYFALFSGVAQGKI